MQVHNLRSPGAPTVELPLLLWWAAVMRIVQSYGCGNFGRTGLSSERCRGLWVVGFALVVPTWDAGTEGLVRWL